MTYFLTTAIAYPNGDPHIGHAYEVVLADIKARARRVRGETVVLASGLDEHGLKMVKTAEAEGVTVEELCERNSKSFIDLNERLGIRLDRFTRTSTSEHKKVAQKLWKEMEKQGDIYLGKYSGWYSVRDEAYVAEKDTILETRGNRTTQDGAPVEWVEEPSWFFRLSRYRDQLLSYHLTNSTFLQPDSSRNEVLSILEGGLDDISISRTTFDWGVPVPDSEGHVMYVWVDALANYLTAAEEGQIWPANKHIIGKDIVKFHAIFWTAFLWSAGYSLPKSIYAHGFILANGRRMSKSTGNVVDPHAMLDRYGSDALRFYLACDFPIARGGDFSEDRLIERNNAHLSNNFGNLISRVSGLIGKKLGHLPAAWDDMNATDSELLDSIYMARVEIIDGFATQDASTVIDGWVSAVSDVNAYLQTEAPWSNPDRLGPVLTTAWQAIKELTVAISPVIEVTLPEELTANQIAPIFPRLEKQ